MNMDGTKTVGSYQGLLMRDQKYLRKNFHKFATFHVKDFANKVKKGVKSAELKLENQASVASSIFNDPNANGTTLASVNGSSDGASIVYDFEEGIRKHSQRVYGPVMSLLGQ